MKKYTFLVAWIIGLFISHSTLAFTPKRIVVFGDSYSDNGNVFRISKGTYPCAKRYWQGRFSNGPVWVEYLAQDYGLNPNNPHQLLDYAYGQAQAKGNLTFQTHNKTEQFNFTVPDIHQQLEQYLAQNKHKLHGTLFIVFIGANDLFNQKNLANINQQRFIKAVITAQANLINTLEQLDAKHFLVVNLRDLTAAPIAKSAATHTANKHPHVSAKHVLADINQLIQKYNKALSKQFKQDKQVHIFDAYQFDKKQLTKTKVTKKACYVNHGDYVAPQKPACKDPQNYFFYDRIHPTTTVAKAMAKAAQST